MKKMTFNAETGVAYCTQYPAVKLWQETFKDFQGWHENEEFYVDDDTRSVFVVCDYSVHCRIISEFTKMFLYHGKSFHRIVFEIFKDPIRKVLRTRMQIKVKSIPQLNFMLLVMGKVEIKKG